MIGDLLDLRRTRSRIGDVRRQSDHLVASISGLHACNGVRVDIAGSHAHAVVNEGLYDGTSKATRAAGHDGHFSLQISTHFASPTSFPNFRNTDT